MFFAFPSSPTSDSKPESLEAHKIKTAFFTHPTLTEIGRRLVSHYLLLTEEELAMWEEDPESFGNSTSPDWLAESKSYLVLQTGTVERCVLTQSRAAWVCQVLHFRNLAMSFRLRAVTQIGELECDVVPSSTVKLDFHHNHITFLKLVFTDLHKVDADTAFCVAASGQFILFFLLKNRICRMCSLLHQLLRRRVVTPGNIVCG